MSREVKPSRAGDGCPVGLTSGLLAGGCEGGFRDASGTKQRALVERRGKALVPFGRRGKAAGKMRTNCYAWPLPFFLRI